jgi:glycosyltransferase involved in cell wall biosynthesis
MADLEFDLQCPVSHVAHAAMAAHVAALRRLAARNVRLIDEVLSRSEYNRLLGGADVVLLPYSRGVYYARTSGPFTEALAAGKPVIATDDTWMSDQLEHFGAGVTVADNDADDLVRAILEVQGRFEELARRARLQRENWVAFHNPARLVKLLCDPPAPVMKPSNASARITLKGAR